MKNGKELENKKENKHSDKNSKEYGVIINDDRKKIVSPSLLFS